MPPSVRVMLLDLVVMKRGFIKGLDGLGIFNVF